MDETIYTCYNCHKWVTVYYNKVMALPGMDYEYFKINLIALFRRWAQLTWRMKLYERDHKNDAFFNFSDRSLSMFMKCSGKKGGKRGGKGR
jgi:hypothetical protein